VLNSGISDRDSRSQDPERDGLKSKGTFGNLFSKQSYSRVSSFNSNAVSEQQASSFKRKTPSPRLGTVTGVPAMYSYNDDRFASKKRPNSPGLFNNSGLGKGTFVSPESNQIGKGETDLEVPERDGAGLRQTFKAKRTATLAVPTPLSRNQPGLSNTGKFPQPLERRQGRRLSMSPKAWQDGSPDELGITETPPESPTLKITSPDNKEMIFQEMMSEESIFDVSNSKIGSSSSGGPIRKRVTWDRILSPSIPARGTIEIEKKIEPKKFPMSNFIFYFYE
jgi:hypothetical protein